MSDIALIWSPDLLAADFEITENDLTSDSGLKTAALISLFTDRRIDDGDVLPEGQTSRRGWWADTAEDKIGSRLWLLDRSKQTPDVLERAEEYARESVQWLIDDLVVSAVDVVTEFLPRPLQGLALEVSFHRPKADPISFRFARTWAAHAAEV